MDKDNSTRESQGMKDIFCLDGRCMLLKIKRIQVDSNEDTAAEESQVKNILPNPLKMNPTGSSAEENDGTEAALSRNWINRPMSPREQIPTSNVGSIDNRVRNFSSGSSSSEVEIVFESGLSSSEVEIVYESRLSPKLEEDLATALNKKVPKLSSCLTGIINK